MNELTTMLLEAPDTQLDASQHPLIKKWSDPPKAIEILEVLDNCVHASLASGFTLQALQSIYNAALDAELLTHEELVARATWRK